MLSLFQRTVVKAVILSSKVAGTNIILSNSLPNSDIICHLLMKEKDHEEDEEVQLSAIRKLFVLLNRKCSLICFLKLLFSVHLHSPLTYIYDFRNFEDFLH